MPDMRLLIAFYSEEIRQEQREIDRIKRELALKNGISEYIELDCRYSDKNYIKESIIKSNLNK